jgi:hypothetical protein
MISSQLLAPFILLATAVYLLFLSSDSRRETHELFLPVIITHDPATAEAPFLIRHVTVGNPFLNYNLTAVFTNSDGQTFSVAGYYDGSGEWRVIFEEPGTWAYHVALRHGQNVAVLEDGTAVTVAEKSGTAVIVGPQVPRLITTGGAYLDWGGPWLKTGVNSPENFLAHEFADHGGPHGALEYLAQEQINSIYMLLLNIGGDGDDVWPFDGYGNKLWYDTVKMKQWQALFAQANDLGIALHLVLAESETSDYLDGGQLGIERKLFYREMVARFAHLPAIIWNVSEESNYTAVQFNEFAAYIRELDWADHPVTFHTYHNNPLQYAGTSVDLYSIQYSPDRASDYVELLRPSGPVGMDEQSTPSLEHNTLLRQTVLYPVLFSGGSLEWYDEPRDQSLENFAIHWEVWRHTRIARQLLESVDFWNGLPSDHLLHMGVKGELESEAFAKAGEWYLVYLPDGVETLDVPNGRWEVTWTKAANGLTLDPVVMEATTGQLVLDVGRLGDWVAVVRPE